MKIIKNIVLWIISVFFILLFLVFCNTIFVPSVLILISGIILLPPINDLLNKKMENNKNIKIYKYSRIILIITFFLIFFVNVPTQDNKDMNSLGDTNTISSNEETIDIVSQPENNTNEVENTPQIIEDTNGKYTGDRVNGKKQGKGKYEWNDGSVYEGEFYEDNLNGYGKLDIPQKGTYEGYFVKGKKSEQGTYMFENKDRYIGKWDNDKMCGQGIYTFANGDKYEGEFSDNKFNGQGTYTKDGKKYSGTWLNNEYKK